MHKQEFHFIENIKSRNHYVKFRMQKVSFRTQKVNLRTKKTGKEYFEWDPHLKCYPQTQSFKSWQTISNDILVSKLSLVVIFLLTKRRFSLFYLNDVAKKNQNHLYYVTKNIKKRFSNPINVCLIKDSLCLAFL